jgi:hypothetical protein
MKRDELRKLNRDELLARAEALGVPRPAVLTQGELIDEIVKRAVPTASGVRGWLGRARDLVAQVVSKGLHLPDAARLFRGEAPEPLPPPPPPLPTVTLAEIYEAQGHLAKAVSVLDQVIASEPSHPVAHELRSAWLERLGGRAAKALREGEAADLREAEAEPIVEHASDVQTEPELIVEHASDIPPEPEPEPIVEHASDVQTEPEPEASHTESAGVPTFRDGLELRALDATKATLTWELRPVRYARALGDHPDGGLFVRVFAAHAEGTAVRSRTMDVAVAGTGGTVVVDGLPPRAHVRACVAWKSSGSFLPLVLGPALTMPSALS